MGSSSRSTTCKSKRRGTWSKRRKNPRKVEVQSAPVGPPFQPARMPGDRSLILELPPELRNEVYGLVSVASTATLHPRQRGVLITHSSLGRVSKQVREEFMSAVYLSTPTIRAHVTDFKFSHIVTFFNKLSEREASALTAGSIAAERRLEIKLHLTDACPPNPEPLQSWLVRLEHPTKRGTIINTSYCLARSVSDVRVPYEARWRVGHHLRWLLTRRPRNGCYLAVPDGKMREEITKIHQAFVALGISIGF